MEEVNLDECLISCSELQPGQRYLIRRNGTVIGPFIFEPEVALKCVSAEEVINKPTKYVIPGYQRGYRWSKDQVEKLLNDIWEWGERQSAQQPPGEEKYSLQPIVIKDTEENSLEVIDGQQRLTTLYIILKAIDKTPKYSLSYGTREGSESFLKEICEMSDRSGEVEHVEYYYFLEAFKAAKAFFSCEGKDSETWYEYLKSYAVFIEYNATLADDKRQSEEVFKDLNDNKIPLEQAELIKGYFLRKDNFEGAEVLKSIMEISREWDRIESRLGDEQFWAWLGQKPTSKPRIELLLRIVAELEEKEPESKRESLSERYKSLIFKEGANNANNLWREVKEKFMAIEDWFDDEQSFHYVGFLCNPRSRRNAQAEKLIAKWLEDYFDSSVTFKERIVNYFFGNGSKQISERLKEKAEPPKDGAEQPEKATEEDKREIIREIIEETINELSSGDKTVRDWLLLFDLLTCIDHNFRFDFERYHKDSYDIEHVHPNCDRDDFGAKDQAKWLLDVYESGLYQEYFCEDVLGGKLYCTLKAVSPEGKREDQSEEVKAAAEDPEAGFDFWEFYEKFVEKWPDDQIQQIGNLCLLDSSTNREYKNKPFPFKVQHIVKKDIAGERYVPPVTKNVFLKYYSGLNVNNLSWQTEDADKHQRAMIELAQKHLSDPKLWASSI